jgi:hypothetical protein
MKRDEPLRATERDDVIMTMLIVTGEHAQPDV